MHFTKWGGKLLGHEVPCVYFTWTLILDLCVFVAVKGTCSLFMAGFPTVLYQVCGTGIFFFVHNHQNNCNADLVMRLHWSVGARGEDTM